jgi:hypothetical protein
VTLTTAVADHKRGSFRAFAALFFLAAIPGACGAQSARVETLGALTDASVPQSIRQALAPKGYRIALDATGPVIELWYRKDVPAQPKGAPTDALYDQLTPYTFIGVAHFTAAASDYRGQSISPSFYSLRYALMPNDGNHLGVAPSRDFLLLVPVAADPGPDALPKFQDLVALSRQASGTKHPAPMSLVPAESAAAPAVTKDDEGHSIFTTSVHLSSGEEVPIALVVRGTAPQ